MAIGFLVALLIAVVFQVISYVLQPKPKPPKPEAAKELDNPVAEAGIPITKVFGRVTVTSPNVLFFGDKAIKNYRINA